MKRLLAALLLLSSPVLAADYPARVVGISDGDTLTVLKGDKTQVKIRLSGVDAPETGQDFGSRAKQAASELAFNKSVTIREMDRDRYGRTVAEVVLPAGKSLGLELVKQGMAWHYAAYSHDIALAQAEATARTAHVGLWSRPNPIPPWDWRKGVGVPQMAEVIGNRRSHVFHAPTCPSVGRMNAENRVEFKTAAEAEAKGYHKAGDCR